MIKVSYTTTPYNVKRVPYEQQHNGKAGEQEHLAAPAVSTGSTVAQPQ